VTLKAGNSLVTPYTLAGDDKEKAIRIAALLQTLDSDSNPRTASPSTRRRSRNWGSSNWVAMTPSTPPGRGAENSGPHQGRRLSGCGESPPLRHPGWRQWPLRGGRQGAERSAGLTDLKTWTSSKFKEYKETLQAETGESGKADRQIVLAMLTMLEVTNNPVVAERLGFTSSAIGSGYSTSLAKVMDVIIHTPGTASVALKGGKGYTRDVAKLMGAYADSLENVAAAWPISRIRITAPPMAMTIPSPSTSTVPRHCGRLRWRWHRPSTSPPPTSTVRTAPMSPSRKK
jgi:hypothetical protein